MVKGGVFYGVMEMGNRNTADHAAIIQATTLALAQRARFEGLTAEGARAKFRELGVDLSSGASNKVLQELGIKPRNSRQPGSNSRYMAKCLADLIEATGADMPTERLRAIQNGTPHK